MRADDFFNLPLDSLPGLNLFSEEYFGWDIGYTELDHMKALNTHAPNTPYADWLPIDAFNPSSAMTGAETSKSNAPSPIPQDSSRTVGDAQPADSPWVSRTPGIISQANFPLASRV